ncbi:hypothetical protein Tco_0214541 [Tanacetum coccineum]
MSFHQALDLILKLDEAAVGCTRDILRQRDCMYRLSEIHLGLYIFRCLFYHRGRGPSKLSAPKIIGVSVRSFDAGPIGYGSSCEEFGIVIKMWTWSQGRCNDEVSLLCKITLMETEMDGMYLGGDFSAAGVKVNVAGYNYIKITTAKRISTVRRIQTREMIKMKIAYQDYLRNKYEIFL